MSATVAVLDGGSFVLPYDTELIRLLAAHGIPVDFHASTTRYNGALLGVLAAVDGVTVRRAGVSGSVAPRWRGALAYAGLLLGLALRSRRYRLVNLQFSAAWPIELPFLWLWRRRLVFTVHNPVPHGFEGRRHRPTAWIAALARQLVFVSESSRDDFLRRYGDRFAARSTVVPHSLLPAGDRVEAVPYRSCPAPRALVFWGNVQPYKGVELFAALARSAELRARGLALEIHGAWSPAMRPLRDELAALGVRVDDRFLDSAALATLLARDDALFLLPYRAASQSGALYTLLHAGRLFACTDVGDLGAFLRRAGLERLLLRRRDAASVLDALAVLAAAPEAIRDAFAAAQQQAAPDAVWPAAARVYAPQGGEGADETIAPR